MTIQRLLLPPLDDEGRRSALIDLISKHARKNYVTTGWIEDAYPNERDWVDQPGNNDPARRVHYVCISTKHK
jgi:hypothetical protein